MVDSTFPRGKNPTTAAGAAKHSLSQDAIFGVNKRSKIVDVLKKTKKKVSQEVILPSVGMGLSIADEATKVISKIYPLTLSKFTVHSMAFCYVLNVGLTSTQVSLPGGTVGVIEHTELSDVLHEATQSESKFDPAKLVTRFQALRCCIIGTNSDGKLMLSARCSMINKGLLMKHMFAGFSLSACVESVEDHGFVLNCGIRGITTFLPKENSKIELFVGQPLECIVKEVNKEARTIIVGLIGYKLESETPIENKSFQFLSLLPGMLLKVTTEKKIDDGLVVNYLNGFHGTIDRHSMSQVYTRDEWKDANFESSTFSARIVFVDYSAKSVRLSMKPHVLNFCSASLPQIGATIDNLSPVELNPKKGLLLRKVMPSDKSSLSELLDSAKYIEVFIPKKSLTSIPLDTAQPETAYSAKVLGLNLVEGFVIGSNLPEVLESTVFHYSHVKVGQLHNVEIKAVKDFGLVVEISGKITGICPLLHTADVIGQLKLSKKFSIGQKVKMRVWEVEKNSIILTNKKSLVDLNDAILLSSFDDARVGQPTVGVVNKILKDGILVSFFNRVKGLLPISVLAHQGISDTLDDFRIGQIVKVIILWKKSNVLKTGHMQRKLILGIDISVDQKAHTDLITFANTVFNKRTSDENQSEGRVVANSNNHVSGYIVNIKDDAFIIQLDDGRTAKLHLLQVFDFANTTDELTKISIMPYSVGDRIENALVLNNDGDCIELTLKPLLISASEAATGKKHTSSSSVCDSPTKVSICVPRSISELVPGEILAGYVTKVENYGVFVRFCDSLTALAPRPSICDRFISSPVGLFSPGDSIKCVVQRVDLVKSRAIVSFKPSLIPPSVIDETFLNSLFREKYLVAEALLKSNSRPCTSWKAYQIGCNTSATVSSIEKYGTIFVADDKETIMLCKSSLSAKVGEIVAVMVIDFDFETGILEIVPCLKHATKNKRKVPVVGQSVHGTILKVSSYYCVVLSEYTLGYLKLADFNNPKSDVEFKVGDTPFVQVSTESRPTKSPQYPHENILQFRIDTGSSTSRTRIASIQQEAMDSDVHHSESAARPSNFKVGTISSWEITKIDELQLFVKPSSGNTNNRTKLFATVHLSQTIDLVSLDDQLTNILEQSRVLQPENSKLLHPLHPFHKLSVGDHIRCEIVKVVKDKSPSDEIHTDGANSTVDCTFVHLRLPQSNMADRGVPLIQSNGKGALASPSMHASVVTKIHPSSVTLALSPFLSAELSILDTSIDPNIVSNFTKFCFVGMRIVTAVTDVVKENNKIQKIRVSRLPIESLIKHNAPLSTIQGTVAICDIALKDDLNFEEGQVVSGIIDLRRKNIFNYPAIAVHLKGDKLGRICITELDDRENWSDLSKFFESQKIITESENFNDSEWTLPQPVRQGKVVTCIVLAVRDNFVELSIRPSRLASVTLSPKIKYDVVPPEGSVVSAYVTNVSAKGCFLRYSGSVSGRVLLKDLADTYVSHPSEEFLTGKLVKGKVMSVDHLLGTVQMSLKPSVLVNDAIAKEEIKTLHPGDVVKGVIQRVNDIGVFITISGTSLVGLSRKAVALDNPNDLIQNVFHIGEMVKAKVLRLSASNLKIALGLKSVYFSDEDTMNKAESFDDSFIRTTLEEVKPTKLAGIKRSAHDESVIKEAKKLKSGNNMSNLLEVEDNVDFNWDLNFQNRSLVSKRSSIDDDSDDNEDRNTKKSKVHDVSTKFADQIVRDRERALADGRLVPETSDDFERLIIAQPNSSYLWVQYIASFLQRVDVDAARAVANRALRTIHFREEEEKYNIWVALLNLEYKFGNKDSLERIFSQAINESKAKQLFLALAVIYEQSSDFNAANELYLRALKRPHLKKSKKVWMAYQKFKLRKGDFEGAKMELSRSLQSLSKHKHVEVISRFAISEYEFGSVDRARVLFEELLHSYPRRTDLWHLYVDKEVKLGNVVQARQLFDRVIASKCNSKNMKTVFKKYLAFEMQFGDEATQDMVKQLARNYVQSIDKLS